MRIEEPILTMSVASNLLGLHPRTMMIYEKAGFVTPFRTATNRRMYSIRNLDELQFIKFLTQGKNVNIAGITVLLEAIEIAGKGGMDLKKLLFPNFEPKQLI